MRDRARGARRAALVLVMAMAAPTGAGGQFAARYPSFSQLGTGTGYGAGVGSGAVAYPSLGYGIRTGQVGAGYGSAYGIYRPSYAVPRAQTTIALQPLYSAITSLPGWNGTTGRVPRRIHHVRRRSLDPPYPRYDRNGNILWPRTIHDDATSTPLRREAEDAFLAAFRESKSTGHASIRPVIAAKDKLSAYERKVLPAVKGQSVSDGDALEAFFVDLNRSLDLMNAYF